MTGNEFLAIYAIVMIAVIAIIVIDHAHGDEDASLKRCIDQTNTSQDKCSEIYGGPIEGSAVEQLKRALNIY